MHSIYGNDFAYVYNDKWAYWGEKMWPFLRKAVKQSVPHASTWLDLCCGSGSLLKFICQEGFSATGIDLSEHQTRYAQHNVPDAHIVQGDIRTLSFAQPFDVVTCMFDSLNYLTLKRDLGRVFDSVRLHLKQNGLFAFDMNTYEGLEDLWCATTATHDTHSTIIIETSFNKKRALGRCLVTGFLKEDNLYRRFQEEHIERGYKAHEIEQLIKKAGFTFKKYDASTFSNPKQRSAKLLYLCRQTTPQKA